MKRTAFLLFIIFCVLNSYSQIPGVKWTKYIRPSAFSGEYIFESRTTNDGGYIVAGIDTGWNYQRNNFINKYSFGRAWIAKLDSGGNTLWSRIPLNVDPHTSGFVSVCSTASGLYVAAGHGNISSANPSDFYLAAYNNSGSHQWDALYGGSGIDRAYSIQHTSDGGYIIAGFTTSNDGHVSGNHSPGTADVWLVKIDASRNIQWQKCFGGSNADSAYAVLQTPDNGYVIAGVSSSADGNLTGNNGLSDAWIFKTDNGGNIQWQKNIGGAGHEAFKSIVINSDSSFTLTGYTASGSVLSNGLKGKTDLWVITLAANNGNILWSKGFGGASDEQGFSIKRTFGNGYLIGGYTESADGDVTGLSGRADAWLLNLTNNGSLIWQKAIGTVRDEFALTAHYLSASDFTITGSANPIQAQTFGDSTDGYAVRLGNTNTIKGILFYDVNRNGIKDAGEMNYNLATIKTEKNGFEQTTIPYNGQFSLDVDTGSYTTTVLQLPYYNAVPASSNSSFTTYFNIDSFSFAIQPVPGIRDLTISAIPLTTARPGFDVFYKVFYQNAGTDTVSSGAVLFKKDNRLNFISATPPVTSLNGDTLKWDYSNLKPLDSSSITIKFHVPSPPVANINDTLLSIAIITPVAGDFTPADDTSIVKQIVVGSFDPNDKTENFGGKISLQNISSGTYINYLIRFQNTGNDTAFNIVIRDTLDAKLDWNSFQMIGSSHAYNLQIVSQNRIAWTFNNIKLVDSIHNESASHGFIAYRIKAMNNLVVGDIIKNSASIYFDFNLPVKTNTQNTIVSIAAIAPPTITSFSPITGGIGTTITIIGTNFTGASIVSFGGVAATSYNVNSATSISAVVGAGASGNVSVTTPGGTATLAGFTFISPPTITSFLPTSAGAGATITITGTNFTGATAVSFGGIAATTFNVNSATSISAVVGAGVSGNVSITTPGGTATSAGFTFIPAPTITSFTPTSAGAGATITITGTNFTDATLVSFGGVAATTFNVNSATSISAVVGAGATGNVSVTTPGGVGILGGFTFIMVTSVGSPNNNSNELVAYPNPGMDFIVINHPASTKIAQLKWIDMLGRTVMLVRVNRNITQTGVNVKSLSPGAYKILWTDGKKLLGRSMIIY